METFMEAVEFWTKIKKNLSEIGKTQEWLCNEAGLDLQSMRNRIYKERFPSIQETLRILVVDAGVDVVTTQAFFALSSKIQRLAIT